jgi:hypothetical protein
MAAYIGKQLDQSSLDAPKVLLPLVTVMIMVIVMTKVTLSVM